MIYTGDRDVPETLFLSDLYDGEGAVEIQVKVLRSRGTGDIVDQYVRFCKISDEERRKHGRTEKAMELLGIPETVRSQYAEMLKQ